MDSNTPTPTRSFDLPQPQSPEVAMGLGPNMPQPETNQQTEQHNMELPATQAPAPLSAQQLAPAAQAPTLPAATLPTTPLIQSAQAQQPTDLTAEDNDLIEKAWVQKAKDIVEKTKDDPFKQNKELNKVKASYIKKRYNVDVKVTEE